MTLVLDVKLRLIIKLTLNFGHPMSQLKFNQIYIYSLNKL